MTKSQNRKNREIVNAISGIHVRSFRGLIHRSEFLNLAPKLPSAQENSISAKTCTQLDEVAGDASKFRNRGWKRERETSTKRFCYRQRTCMGTTIQPTAIRRKDMHPQKILTQRQHVIANRYIVDCRTIKTLRFEKYHGVRIT